MKQPNANTTKLVPDKINPQSGEKTIPKSIIAALKKGTKIPDLSKLMIRSNLEPDRIKYLVKNKPNYKTQYDAKLEKYIEDISIKIYNRNINKKISVENDELIKLIDETSHFLVEKFSSDLPNKIKKSIKSNGIRIFAKNCTKEEARILKEHLKNRKRNNDYYKYACLLVERGFEEWDTVVPTSLIDEIPREVRIEISRAKFGKWCSDFGMKYEKIAERVKSKIQTPSNMGGPKKANSTTKTISIGARPSQGKARPERDETNAEHRQQRFSTRKPKKEYIVPNLELKQLESYADRILRSLKRGRNPAMPSKKLKGRLDTNELEKVIKEKSDYSSSYEDKLKEFLNSINPSKRHSSENKEINTKKQNKILQKMEKHASKGNKKKIKMERKWIQSHATLISINKKIVLEFEKKDAKSLHSFFRKHDGRIEDLKGTYKDLAGRPELKKVDFKKLHRYIKVFDLWKSKNFSGIGAELEYFKWPSTAISELQNVLNVELTDIGENLLTQFGYRVGKSRGIPETERHRILDDIYHLPEDKFERGISNMGRAESCHRLRRIVRAIILPVRLNKKRQADTSLAISHWETDLQYLKRKYYDGQCDGYWIWNSEVNFSRR